METACEGAQGTCGSCPVNSSTMTHQRAWGSVAIRLRSTLSYSIGYKTMFTRLRLAIGDSILQAAFNSVLGEKDDYNRWVYPETASSLKRQPYTFIGKN